MLGPIHSRRPRPGILGDLFGIFRSHPARRWQPRDEPLPAFDLTTGALGSFRLGEGWEQAEFLGRPDRVDKPSGADEPDGMKFHYLSRGFELFFEAGEFAELACIINPPSNTPAKGSQGYSRPQIKGGIQLTPETTAEDVVHAFGAPSSEENYCNRLLIYVRGRYVMDFEFEKRSERLLTWTAALDD